MQKPAKPYTLSAGKVKSIARDFIFATTKAGDHTFSIIFEVRGNTGLRSPRKSRADS